MRTDTEIMQQMFASCKGAVVKLLRTTAFSSVYSTAELPAPSRLDGAAWMVLDVGEDDTALITTIPC